MRVTSAHWTTCYVGGLGEHGDLVSQVTLASAVPPTELTDRGHDVMEIKRQILVRWCNRSARLMGRQLTHL